MEQTPQILIVEDSETQALYLRSLLEQEGWNVSHASSAESALEELNGNLPNLIIADYHLPGIRGDELCRRIRMNVHTRGIPILILTMDESSGSEPLGLDSGADDYISKSVSTDTLLPRVRALLRKSTVRSDEMTPKGSRFRRARILAIDDSPTYLECLSEALLREGYEVERAQEGAKGLECISRGDIDCVVVDLVMPDMDGIEVCKRVNAMDRTHTSRHATAVIILTAHETKEDMARGLEAGADDFVGKSSDMAVLTARIRALLRRKFYEEENHRIREQLLRTEMEVAQARAAQELAEIRAVLVEELERKNKELEAFSYSVSHDLRAPLRSIDGFSALLEDRVNPLDEKGLHYLHQVRASAQRMGELIDDLLELSRVGRTQLRNARVNFSDLGRVVVAELQKANPGRQIQVFIQDGMVVEGDPGLLQIVLENLLGNAWKFTAGTDGATIEFGRAQNLETAYFVRDNGVGFDMKYVAKLFTPFQRLHSDDEFPGTGIGLATVYRIIDRHGGRVWAESELSKGSAFFWTLAEPRSAALCAVQTPQAELHHLLPVTK